ncbi:MAG TPA: hypothetical protein VFW73_05865 [Lacipirellulaceae bacterium]|nr:hypothetical protein [Lacipirellulaceae bacterium]
MNPPKKAIRHRTEAVDDALADALRNKSPGDRIQMTGDANDTARLIMAAGIRYSHQDWTDDQVQREVARRMLDAAD